MLTNMIKLIVDLINNCVYNPRLELIGITTESNVFDVIINTCI